MSKQVTQSPATAVEIAGLRADLEAAERELSIAREARSKIEKECRAHQKVINELKDRLIKALASK